MMFLLLPPLLVLVLIAFIIYKKKRQKYLSTNYSGQLPKGCSYQYINNGIVRKREGEGAQYFSSYQKCLKSYDIKSIYLIHGTFVGDDPWHILSLLKKMTFKKNKDFFVKIKKMTKKGQDFLVKDFGNFTGEHIRLITKIFDSKVKVETFNWSSGNHHCARVKAAVSFISELAQKKEKHERILIISHSHGSQLLAIMTQFFESQRRALNIINTLGTEFSQSHFWEDLEKVKTMSFDFVTLGAPPRIKWFLSKKLRVLHIINHRGDDLLGGSLKGLPFTKDGDYIQQFAGEGSDILAPSVCERSINLEFDKIFDVGVDLSLVARGITRRQRFHNAGHHFLVDFGDSDNFPNFYKTVFGHIIYTKVEHLNLLFNLITQRFYKV